MCQGWAVGTARADKSEGWDPPCYKACAFQWASKKMTTRKQVPETGCACNTAALIAPYVLTTAVEWQMHSGCLRLLVHAGTGCTSAHTADPSDAPHRHWPSSTLLYHFSSLPTVFLSMSILPLVSKRQIKSCSFNNCLICEFRCWSCKHLPLRYTQPKNNLFVSWKAKTHFSFWLKRENVWHAL